MGNVCINTINAEGTPSQVDDLIGRLSACFGKALQVNDIFAIESKATASLSVDYQWRMPQKELLEITCLLSDTQGLYIRVTAEEPGEEYFEQSVFQDGKWTFETPPSINDQILTLTRQGIEQIKKRIKEKGIIDFEDNCNYNAVYINDDGYAECPYFKRIEIEENGKLSVLLSDNFWLYEEVLTPMHIMDMLTLINQNDEADQ